MDYKTVTSKKTFIFDVDGTLYSQPKMRLGMAVSLCGYYALHFRKLREFYALYLFRKLREAEEYRTKTMPEQIGAAALMAGIKADTAKAVIDKWMFKKPLEILKKSAFENLITFINEVQSKGCRIVIYSDYPAAEKLDVLGVKADAVFTPETEGVGELKPSKRAMDYIIKSLDCPLSEIIYVGDRDEKDGESARIAGVDYCDIKMFLGLLG